MSSNNLEGLGLNIALDSRIYLFNYKLLLLTFVLDINYGLVTRSSNNLEGPRFNITEPMKMRRYGRAVVAKQ